MFPRNEWNVRKERHMKRVFVLFALIILSTGSLVAQKTLEEVLLGSDERLLLLAIRQGEDSVKQQGIKAIGEKGTASADSLDIVIKYSGYGVNYSVPGSTFQDTSWLVRREAALALAKLKAEEGVQNLVDVLRQERRSSVKVAQIYALGEIGDPAAVNVLLDQVRFSREQNIIYTAVVSLGKIGDKSSFVELLNVAQEDRHLETVRQAAVEALDKIKWD